MRRLVLNAMSGSYIGLNLAPSVDNAAILSAHSHLT
jgi:hypothetical protein